MRCGLLLASALLLAACSRAGDPQTLYTQGLDAYRGGEIRVARIAFMNALQADPDHRAARVMLARVALDMEDGVAAEAELARAARSGVPAGRIHHLHAHARLLQGDAEGAIANAAAAEPAYSAYAARIAGLAHLALDDPVAARAAFDRALSLAPEDPLIWIDIARFRRARGDIGGAIEAADRAVSLDPGSADALVVRGELMRGQYGLQAALPWFDRALEVEPDHLTALLERATTYGDLGRMRDMLADTRAALAASPGEPTAFYLQAMLAGRARNWDLARALLQRTGHRFEDLPAAMLLASAIDYETGNAERAVRRLERLVAAQPANRRARRLLAAAQWRVGDAATTTETLRPIVDRPDADSYSLALIGQALESLGDPRAALYLARAAAPRARLPSASPAPLSSEEIDRLRLLAARQSDAAPAQINLIRALIGRGMHAEALDRALRLRAANPGAPDAHVLVGDARGVSGDFAGAAEEYRRAANISFTEPVALRLIEALRRTDQQAAADTVLRLFLDQNPRNIPMQMLLAARHMETQSWDAAIQLYEGLRARIGSRDAVILNNLAWAYSERGDLERAIPLARHAWSLDRTNSATTDTYGWILFKSGRRAEGLALLERASRDAPSWPSGP
jgi:cellulose synthase operon protein C